MSMLGSVGSGGLYGRLSASPDRSIDTVNLTVEEDGDAASEPSTPHGAEGATIGAKVASGTLYSPLRSNTSFDETTVERLAADNLILERERPIDEESEGSPPGAPSPGEEVVEEERLVDQPVPPAGELPRAWEELMYAAGKSVNKIDQVLEKLSTTCPAMGDEGPQEAASPPMFEHFLIAGAPLVPPDPVEPGSVTGESPSEEQAQLLFHYPDDKRVKTQDLPLFCFPEGIQLRPLKRTKSDSALHDVMFGHHEYEDAAHSYVFQFSGTKGNFYGVCVRFHDVLDDGPSFLDPSFEYPPPKTAPLVSGLRCYCLLTRVPLFVFHFNVLYTLLERNKLLKTSLHATQDSMLRRKLIDGEKKVALAMLARFRLLEVPEQGGELVFQPFEDARAVLTHCVPCGPSMSELLHGHGCQVVMQCLSLDNFLYVLQSILLERKIVFVCRVIGVLSAVVMSILTFLRPLSWQSMFVPILPPKLHHFFDAPVPFIVGVTEVHEGWKPRMNDAVFVFIEEDRIEGWNLMEREATMPALGALAKTLRPHFPLVPQQRAKGMGGPPLSLLRPYDEGEEGKAGRESVFETLQNYITMLISRLRQFEALQGNPFAYCSYSPAEETFMTTCQMTRMVTHYMEEAWIKAEAKGGAGSVLVKSLEEAGKTFRLVRHDLLKAQGVNPEEEEERSRLPAEWSNSSPAEEEEEEEDIFLTLLDTIDADATRSDQGQMRKTMRNAKHSTSSAVSSYQDYITSMLEAQSPPTSPASQSQSPSTPLCVENNTNSQLAEASCVPAFPSVP